MNRFIQQSYSTPSRRRTRFEPTERFSERKRSLFPTLNKENEQDSDSDIGHMSPLDVSSSPDRYDSPFSSPHISDIFRKEIHEPFSNRQNFNELFDNITPIKQKEEPEKILAPNTPSPVDSPDKGVTNLIIPETPTKGSPTKELKTPQETSSTNLQLPKLVRKSLVDLTNTDKSTLKRKPDSPDESPCNKSLKLDNSTKIPKARTALFPDIILPAKSFYPKSIENYKPSKYVFSEPIYKSKKAQRKSHTMYLCHRKKINKSNCGQINAGVRHGIKKPKHKTKMSRSQIYNVAKDLLDNSPLNEFLDKVNKGENTSNENVPSSAQLNSMDSIIRNIDLDIYKAQPLTSVISPIQTPQKERNSLKRPSSPAPEQNRKFFKSSKPQATVTINKNIKLKIDNGEMHLVEKKKRKHHFHELTFDTSDLNCDGENIIHKNIGDIMKSLDDEDVETQHENTNNIVLTAYSSIAASDNSIQLHNIPVTISETHIRTSENLQVSGSINNVRNELNNLTQHNPPIKKVTEMLLSPTSLMCDMTSGLALNSPKNDIVHGQISVNYELKKCLSFSDDMAAKDKLFPIFYNPTQPKIVKKQTQPVQHSRKSKPTDYDQMIIDAGQKRYGHTRCKECDLVYIIDDPYDEAMHHNYHHSINVLRFDVS